MAYKKYETKGLIMDTFDIGEADKQVLILTRDLGLVFAFAKSVRVMKSKLRPSLSKLSLVNIVLIKGRAGWKITNVNEVNKFSGKFELRAAEKIFLKIISLVKRMVQGEEKNLELFDIIKQTAGFLVNEKNSKTLDSIETLAVLRILNSLGYIKDSDVLRAFLKGADIDRELLADVPLHKKVIISEINRAIEESHL